MNIYTFRSRFSWTSISNLPLNYHKHFVSSDYQISRLQKPSSRTTNLLKNRSGLFTERIAHRTLTLKMAFSSQAGHIPNQVFIGYRREELRETFIPHLLPKLRTARVNYFIDENERKGRPINYLFTRLKESVIALALFSKRVPESKYCLEELAMMKELVEGGKLIVIPVFVNVTPEDVKKLKGVFGKNFREMKRKYAGEPEKVQKWEEAVEYIAGILGESWDDRKWRNFGFTQPCNTSNMLLAGGTVRAVERELLEIDPNHGKTEDVGPIGTVIASGMIAIFCGDVIPRVFLNKGSFRSFASLCLGLWVFFFVLSQEKKPPPVTPSPNKTKKKKEKEKKNC